jgi:hypothetical protein
MWTWCISLRPFIPLSWPQPWTLILEYMCHRRLPHMSIKQLISFEDSRSKTECLWIFQKIFFFSFTTYCSSNFFGKIFNISTKKPLFFTIYCIEAVKGLSNISHLTINWLTPLRLLQCLNPLSLMWESKFCNLGVIGASNQHLKLNTWKEWVINCSLNLSLTSIYHVDTANINTLEITLCRPTAVVVGAQTNLQSLDCKVSTLHYTTKIQIISFNILLVHNLWS